MTRDLSFGHVRSLLASGVDLPGCVLVGGQALNYWAEYFNITEYGAALSEDIDFIGSANAAIAFAQATGGSVRVAGPGNTHSPNTAMVTVRIEGVDRVVDFLGSLMGFSVVELRRVIDWAVTVREIGPDGGQLLVMHPVHCLTSQLENVYGATLDRRRGPQGRRAMARVQLAIEACWYAVLESGERDALRIVEKVHKLSLLDAALRALEEDGVDLALAIPAEHMPPPFLDERWPQLQRERQATLGNYRNRRNRRGGA